MTTIALLLVLAAQAPSPRASAPGGSEAPAFTRFAYEDFDRGGLYTATVTFRRGDVEVDLVSVVHVGDKAYYTEIEHELRGCDLVFFELVAGAAQESVGALSALQQAAGDALELSFQLNELDYRASNFVHSDLTWAELQDVLGGRPIPPPSKKQLLERFLPRPRRAEGQRNDYFADNPELKRSLKVFLGQLLGDIPAALAQLNLENPDERSDVLIAARNRRAMDVLTPHLVGPTRVALLWGAAHMPDFARRLKTLGFAPAGCRWHLAWRIGPVREQRWF